VVGLPGLTGDPGAVGVSGNATYAQITRVIASSQMHTFVMLDDGRVLGWGANDLGQLGIGFTQGSVRRPYTVALPFPCVDLSSNYYTSCFLLNNTKIYCTGGNNYGQLGFGSTSTYYPGGTGSSTYSYSSVPLEVGSQFPGGMAGFTSVVVGGDTTQATVCANRGGTVYCWGYNPNGQTGCGTQNTVQHTPLQVQSLPTNISKVFVAKGYGDGEYALALNGDGTVWSWGYSGSAGSPPGMQLGRDTNINPNNLAAQVQRFPGDTAGLTNIVDVVMGGYGGYGTTCALSRNGTVYCWGYNAYGACGVGINTAYIYTATAIVYPTGFVARRIFGYVGGAAFFCAIHAVDTGVYCWGFGSIGNLGNTLDGVACVGTANGFFLGSSSSYCFTPWKVNGPTNSRLDTSWNYNITDVAISGTQNSPSYPYYHACALRVDGQVWCWGYNGYGNLGDGTATSRSYALRVANLINIRAIFSEQYYSGGTPYNTMYALETSNTTLWAWGYNGYYNLGIYQGDNMYAPVSVQGLRFAKLGQ